MSLRDGDETLRNGEPSSTPREDPSNTDELRGKLQGEVLATSWRDLAPHAARDALLLVAARVDLLDVATALAQDDVARVQAWLATGDLERPRPDAWAEDGPRFQAVIVQPWVLAQVLSGQG